MTEPVAYWNIPQFGNDEPFVSFEPYDGNVFESIPLYTAEQFQLRVKMTKKQNDIIITCLANNISFYKFYCENVLEKESFTNLTETDVLEAWLNPWSIEIVPSMKWFVRSKKQYKPDMDQGISESGYLYLTQGDIYSVEYHEMTTFKDEATQFETEDEAKLWTTPDTEAVQLPVEEEY